MIGVSANLEPDGGAVGREIAQRGRIFHGYTTDFSERAAVYDLVEALRAGPPIDVLVNNAGTIRRDAAAEHGDKDWDEVLEVNLTAQFVLTREIGRLMLERGAGKIVFSPSSPSKAGSTFPGTQQARAGSRS